MSYCGYVTKLENVRRHPNADRLTLANVLGGTVIVGDNAKTGDVVIYFASDGQLSEEYCIYNDLIRRKNEDGTYSGGFLDPVKRNVRIIKLRGEYSDGLCLPLISLAYTGVDISTIQVGDTITVVNGHEICRKYIPRTNPPKSVQSIKNGKTRKETREKTPYFAEHVDTPQLRFVMHNFQPGDIICLTEKVHGTSSRNANSLVISRAKRTIWDRILRRPGKEIKEYKYLVGTRRTTVKNSVEGYYGSNQFRIDWGKKFIDKLHEGECVFGEIAGFIPETGQPIMATANNKLTKDKDFIKQYGNTTTFSYGCSSTGIYTGPDGAHQEMPKSRYFIYRMTYTSSDGYVIEYPWDLTVLRAKQMGFEVVPELERFIYTTEADFMEHINKWMDIPSTIDSSHVIEGVVIRALNDPGLRIAKNKSNSFKLIEGIIKADAETADIEEMEEILV